MTWFIRPYPPTADRDGNFCIWGLFIVRSVLVPWLQIWMRVHIFENQPISFITERITWPPIILRRNFRRRRRLYSWFAIADKTVLATQRQTKLGDKTGPKGTSICHTSHTKPVREPARLHPGIRDNLRWKTCKVHPHFSPWDSRAGITDGNVHSRSAWELLHPQATLQEKVAWRTKYGLNSLEPMPTAPQPEY